MQEDEKGKYASPLQIATAHMVKEKTTYMRDYILDEDGHVEELCFNKVKNLSWDYNTPRNRL